MNSLYLIQILLLSICSLISSVPIQKEGETVIGLFMVTLNTARSPGKYLKDDRNIEFWEKYGGFSQQTALGKEQIVDIGKFLKNYYKDFLTEKYHPKNVYVRSIDTDRSLSSAQALIYGMYPDVVSQSTDQQWSSQSDWVPKPIHTHSKPLDPIFTVTAQSCPAYDVIKEESMNSEAYLAVENSKKDFMKEVAIYSGFEIKRYIDIWDVSENILCQIHHGFTLDQFSTDNLDEIKDAFFYTSNFLYAETHEKSKLIAGPLLNDMVDRINDKLNGKTTHQVTVYSLGGAHGQFYGLIGLLGLAEIPARPFLGSTYIFELLKVNSSTFIRVMFRTNDVGQPITINPVNIKGCEEYCPLNKFNQIVQDKIVKDTTAACAIGGNNNSIKNNPSIFFLVLSVFLTSAFKQF